jgi:hypothetical protein
MWVRCAVFEMTREDLVEWAACRPELTRVPGSGREIAAQLPCIIGDKIRQTDWA